MIIKDSAMEEEFGGSVIFIYLLSFCALALLSTKAKQVKKHLNTFCNGIMSMLHVGALMHQYLWQFKTLNFNAFLIIMSYEFNKYRILHGLSINCVATIIVLTM